jgi:hypothetical protein
MLLWHARKSEGSDGPPKPIPRKFPGTIQGQPDCLQQWNHGTQDEGKINRLTSQGQKTKGARMRAPSSKTPFHPIPEQAGTHSPPREKSKPLDLCKCKPSARSQKSRHSFLALRNIKGYCVPATIKSLSKLNYLQFFTYFVPNSYRLWENSSADGGADGGGECFGPMDNVFGVLGFDHDPRFGFGA